MEMIEAMEKRVSTRAYRSEPVDRATLRKVETAVGKTVVLHPETRGRIELVTSSEEVRGIFKGFVGNVGEIQPPHAIVGISTKQSGALENLAFIEQQVVLEATKLGLATCWVSGSFDRSAVAQKFTLGDNEVIANVIALGYGQSSFFDSAMHAIVKSSRRKPIEEIVCSGKWGASADSFLKDHPKLGRVLELTRRAPSARNAQPIRVLLDGHKAVFLIQSAKPTDYQRLDAGIFMSQFFLAATENGVPVIPDGLIVDDGELRSKYRIPKEVSVVGSFSMGG